MFIAFWAASKLEILGDCAITLLECQLLHADNTYTEGIIALHTYNYDEAKLKMKFDLLAGEVLEAARKQDNIQTYRAGNVDLCCVDQVFPF